MPAKAKTLKEWIPILLNNIKEIQKKDVEGKCWEYQGSKIRKNYGRFRFGGKEGKFFLVHRVICEYFKGKILNGLLVCHICDNPPCCNPDHLYVGTYQNNSDDKVKRGRHSFGEKHTIAKFSDQIIKEIRNHPGSYSEIMKKYGISNGYLSRIKNSLRRIN